MCHELERKVNKTVRPIITHMLKIFSIEFQQGNNIVCALITLEGTRS